MLSNCRAYLRIPATAAALALGASLIQLPLMSATVPIASAQDCSETHRTATGGALEWGVSDRWMNYLGMPFVNGTVGGSAWTGSTYRFTPAEGQTAASGSQGTVKLEGDMRFRGHEGALNMAFSDITLSFNGNRAQLLVDYETTDPENRVPGAETEIFTGDDVPLVDISLRQAVDFDSNEINLAGTTSLTSQGSEIFGAYQPRTAFADTEGTLTLDDACGSAPSLQDGGGAGGAGAKDLTGIAGFIAGTNDVFSEINKLFANTEQIMDSVESLDNRINGRSGSTGNRGNTGGITTGGTGATAPGETSGTGTGTPSASGGVTGGTRGNGAAGATNGTSRSATSTANGAASTPSTSGGGSAVCTDSDSKGVTSAQAQWGVRESFRNYIGGAIAKGGWETGGVGENNGIFQFSGDSGAVNIADKSGSLLFPGAIRFTGHGGTLDTRFSNLEIQFAGNSGQLVVNATSNSTEGEPRDFGRVVLANLNFSQLSVTDSSVEGTATPVLTGVGSEAFGSFYPEGDTLDQISFSASLGGSSNCAAGQGSQATGTSTGTGDVSAASALRDSGSSSASNSSVSAANSASEGGEGSVFDEMDLTDASGSTANPNSNQFSIKATGQDGGSGFNDQRTAGLLMLVAAFVVAGGALSSFVRRHPNAR